MSLKWMMVQKEERWRCNNDGECCKSTQSTLELQSIRLQPEPITALIHLSSNQTILFKRMICVCLMGILQIHMLRTLFVLSMINGCDRYVMLCYKPQIYAKISNCVGFFVNMSCNAAALRTDRRNSGGCDNLFCLTGWI